MFKWLEKLKELLKKKENSYYYRCESCVYWKAEEEFNKNKISDNIRFCGKHGLYRYKDSTCNYYIEEKFKPHKGSIVSEELNLDLETSIEKLDDRGSRVDTEN